MDDDEDVLKEFLIDVVRRACIMCVRWIERRYKLPSSFVEKVE
jgi:hypothetical protein